MRLTKLYFVATLSLCLFSATNKAIEIEKLNDMEGALLANRHDPFLGIGSTFGRWENGLVPIAYNPSGAPASVTVAEMEARFASVFSTLESVAGLKFDYRGISSAAYDDDTDSVVVIAWTHFEEGFGGRAGPNFGSSFSSSDRLGYSPYVDGTFRLGSNITIGPGAENIILHELIHLLGFGHSENPISIMNTTRTFFDLPQQDDIDALQALYGPPDQLVIPRNTVNFSSDTSGSNAAFNSADSGFHIRLDGADINDVSPISEVNANHGDNDAIFYLVSFTNASSGDLLSLFTNNPTGDNMSSSIGEINFQNGSIFLFVSRVSELRLQSGNWTTQLALNGAFFAEAQLPVIADPLIFNRTPETQLSTQSLGNGKYNLTLTTNDPEGDAISIDWHIPGSQPITDGATSLSVQVDSSSPQQVFALVTDNGDHTVNVPGGAGTGFGNVASRYLITPLAQDTPSFFTDSGILHIPSIDIGGTVFSLNFQLTTLSGVQFKFLEFDQLANFGTTPLATFDLTDNTLLLHTLLIDDGASLQSFSDVKFQLDETSLPIRVTLLL